MGFYLRAIRDSERAARSLGAPASRIKLYAFMLSAGLTSVAGALYATMFGFVDPESGLGILISVKMLIMAALGGAGLLFGPLVGAAILVPLEEISNNLLGGKGAGLTFVVYGAIIVLIARFQPGGILTLIKRLSGRGAAGRRSRRRRREPAMLLEARQLTKAFGSFKAVDAASVTLEQGDILGLIGPNGAGKSTFFNCLTGDLLSTSGKVLFEGRDITRLAPEARARPRPCAHLPGAADLRGPVGAGERDDRRVPAHRPSRRGRGQSARRCWQRVGMSGLADAPARSLGTPGRKRLEIARALATEPRVLLLDEAMAGPDPARGAAGDRAGARHPPFRHYAGDRRAHHGSHHVAGDPRGGVSSGPRDRARQPARGHRQPGGDRGLSRQARGKAAAGHTPVELMGCRRRGQGRTGDMTAPLLRIAHLEVHYGDLIGVSDVSLDVPEGSVVALLGSNGGGKTTVLNAIAGLIPGAFRIDPVSWRGDRRPAGVLDRAQGPRAVAGRLAAVRAAERREQPFARRHAAARQAPRTAHLLDRVYEIFPKLAERRSQRAGTMSGGERQMLAVGRALMSDPKLLMLDEPSLGLAPAVVESMYETFGRLHREGLTILLAEQSIELALEVADFATVLQVGKSVLSGTAAELANDPQVQKVYLGTG